MNTEQTEIGNGNGFTKVEIDEKPHDGGHGGGGHGHDDEVWSLKDLKSVCLVFRRYYGPPIDSYDRICARMRFAYCVIPSSLGLVVGSCTYVF